MKTRLISALCVSLVLVLAATATAQIKANSDEDKAYTKIAAEKNPDNQIPLLIDFEKRFPQSKVLSNVYLMLVDIYNVKGDNPKVVEYGEKTLKVDPQNVTALVTVSRALAIQGKNLEVAVSYAEKAVANVEKMKSEPAPANYSKEEWNQLIKDNDEAAKGQLTYAKAVKR